MRTHTLIAIGFILAIVPISARAQCPVDPPQVGDFRSDESGNLNSVATWSVYDGTAWVAAGTTPGDGSNVSICEHHVLVTAHATIGDLYVAPGGHLETTCFVCGINLLVIGDLENNGRITTGTFDKLTFEGGEFTNEGVLDGAGSLDFGGHTQTLHGSGRFEFVSAGPASDGVFSIKTGSATSLGTNVVLNMNLTIGLAAALSLGNNRLTLENKSLFNEGSISGPGLFVTTGNVIFYPSGYNHPGAGTFSAPLQVASGVTKIAQNQTIQNDVAVDALGTLTIETGGGAPTLTVGGDLLLNGTLNGNGRLLLEGETLTNNGAITVDIVAFNAMSLITGVGTWSPSNFFSGVHILDGAVATLGNNLTLNASVTVQPAGELSLNGNTLTFADKTFYNEGMISGPGLFATTGNVIFYPSGYNHPGAGTFSAPLQVASGVTKIGQNQTIQNDVTVDALGTLTIETGGGAPTLTVGGDLLLNGTLNGNGRLLLEGETLTNNGAITVDIVAFSATSTIVGAGSWSPANFFKGVHILSGGTATLGNDVTFTAGFRIEPDAGFSTGTHTAIVQGGKWFTNVGRIAGSGVVDFASAVQANWAGSISPGLSPGILTLVKNYSHSNNSFDIELDNSTTPGSGHDQVAIIGSANLNGGKLNVSVTNGYWPSVGDAYTILTCSAGCLGAFSSVNVLTAGFSFATSYNANDVVLTVTAVPNTPPAADAGSDQTVECSNEDGTSVALDASGSSDPDGDALSYTWTGAFPEGGGTMVGAQVHVTLPPGEHTLTLTVEDPSGATDTDEVVFTIVDTTPPVITLSGADQIVLQCRAPYVEPGAAASDLCCRDLAVTISGAVDHTVPGDYTITYTATDNAGLTTNAMRTVTVLDSDPPNLLVTPLSHDFGDVTLGDAAGSPPFSMENNGDCPLEITMLQLAGANSADFGLATAPTTPLVLDAGEQTFFEVLFTPSAAGIRAADVQIDSSDPDATQTLVPLTGNGLDAMPPLEHPFLLLAGERINVEMSLEWSGDAHSNGSILLQKGGPSTYSGNLSASGSIDIAKDNVIDGDVTAPVVRLDKKSTVNGTVSTAAASPVGLPPLSFTAGGPDVTVAKGEEITLPPGSYGAVSLEKDARLGVSEGEYFLEALHLAKGAVLDVSVLAGPVAIHVTGEVILESRTRVEVSGAPASPSRFFALNSLGDVDLRSGSEMTGALNVPQGRVTLHKEAVFRGSIAAREIDIAKDSRLLHHDAGAVALLKHLEGVEDPLQTIAQTSPAIGIEASTESAKSLPKEFALEPNYPNPFNPTTTISFTLPERSDVRVAVFDILGRQLATLISGDLAAGRHETTWSANGHPSGLYFVRMRAGSFAAHRRILLAK